MIEAVLPDFLLLENVRGFTSGLLRTTEGGEISRQIPASERLHSALQSIGYDVASRLINASDWGVPQRRIRFFALAVRRGSVRYRDANEIWGEFDRLRLPFLAARGLNARGTTVLDAIGDLRTVGRTLERDPEHPRFMRLRYAEPSSASPYLKLLRQGTDSAVPNSLRLPQHRESTQRRFRSILGGSRKGHALNSAQRKKLGINKHTTIPLCGESLAPTITTLPDDIVHFDEPRVLTVRELARLQSFPDGFRFAGKYTTGGLVRKRDCPRYSQVGNAVPPLLAEALGMLLHRYV